MTTENKKKKTKYALVSGRGTVVMEFGDIGTMDDYVRRYKEKHGTEPSVKRAVIEVTTVTTFL